MVFTVYDGTSFVEYASGELAPDGLAREVRGWASGIAVKAGGPPLPAEAAGTSTEAATRSFRTAMEIDPTTVPLAEKLAHVAGIQRQIHGKDSRIVQARVQYTDRNERTAFARPRAVFGAGGHADRAGGTDRDDRQGRCCGRTRS